MGKGTTTEKKILHAAIELFVRKGYHATSIQDITQNVGLTKGAFYAHFKSKGELLYQIIEEFKTLFLDQLIKDVSDHSGSPADKIHRCMSFSAEFARTNENLCVFLTFLTNELKSDVDFEIVLKGVYRKYQKFLSKIFLQGIRSGQFKSDLDPDLAALSFMALHDGILHQWILNKDITNGRRLVRTLRNIIFQGISN